jgi:hypothetical protein
MVASSQPLKQEEPASEQDQPYSFSYEESKVLLRLIQAGYWTIDEFRAFEREFLARHARIRAKHKGYRVLADCRNYPVQSAEIGQAFAALFEKLMAENKAHYAILTPSVLNKIQARRALPYENIEIFADEDEAMAWLFEDGSLPG